MPRLSTSIISYLNTYASKGWKMIPISSNGEKKEPLIKGWTTTASCNLDQINDWWQRWPDANIGIATGRTSGIWVLDVDIKKDKNGEIILNGLDTLKSLQDQHGQIDTRMIQTGGGGLHFYFKYDLKPNQKLKNGIELLKGIDIRGDGGQVVAPPSIHQSGNHYEPIHDIPPQKAPDWLIKLLKEKNIIVSIEEKKTNKPIKRTDKTSAYGKTALTRQCENVRTAPEGTRNHTLNKAAYSIGRLVGGEIEMNEALTMLEEAGKDAGLDIHEIKKTVNSGISAGMKNPKSAPKPKEKLNLFSNHYHYTDMGNSYRFKDFADKNIKYCYAWNSWLIWDQTRWQLDETGEIMTKAKEMINEMYKQAASISSEKEETRKAALKHTMQTSNSNKIQAFIHLTKNEVPVLHETLDDKPFLLNTQTGTVDLKNGILKEQERNDLLTKRINFGICKRKPIRWINFLNDIFMGDHNLIRFVQKAAGYSLTGDISEQCMFILYGTGRNGKSTFLNVLSDIFGDYACNTPAETLMIKKNDTIPNDIARLKGMRFVTAYETEDNKRLAEAKIKALTGGDIITARFMRGEYFQFKPTFKLWLATNHKPRIKGTDEGIWRRIKLIPFNYCVPKDKMDKHLQDKLMAEAEEILTWAIEGTNIWEKEGLGEAEAVTLATNEYRSESDAIGLFLKEYTEKEVTSITEKTRLYQIYKHWAESNGEYPMASRTFTRAMKERGYVEERRGKGSKPHWLGLALKTDTFNDPNTQEFIEEEF